MTSSRDFVNVPNFPLPGTLPDLKFYYNRKWLTKDILATNSDNLVSNINGPITLDDKSDPLTQNIGFLLIPEFLGNDIYNHSFCINFNKESGGGGITFTDNQITRNTVWGPNQKLVFRITGGSGDYTFSNGFVVIDTTLDLGRYISVYFFKSESKIPDLRGVWDYSVKVLRLDSPIDTMSFPRSYRTSKTDNCIVQQDWDGDKQYVILDLPPALPLRPTKTQLPGILTFVNGKLQLVVSDVDDNGLYTGIVSETDSNGNVTGFKGLYTETGFAFVAGIISPEQKPTVGEWELKKRV